MAAVSLGRTDDLTVSQAAAGQRHRHHDRPVIQAVGVPWVPIIGVRPNSPMARTSTSSSRPWSSRSETRVVTRLSKMGRSGSTLADPP